MPLLCISLLVLVLLPLSLSCDSKRTQTEVRDNFSVIVRTLMDNTRENITDKLQNLSCRELKHKPPSCSAENTDIVEILLIQACEMQSLRLRQTKELARIVQDTIECPCPKKMTKDPSVRLQQRRIARNPKEKLKKKLCKVDAILSAMTVCYEKLNSLLMGA